VLLDHLHERVTLVVLESNGYSVRE
jgi:hypothetical protein